MDDNFRIEKTDFDVTLALAQARAKARGFQTLYGQSVLSDDLLNTFNGELTQRITFVTSACDEAALARKAYQCLYDNVMIVEDKPIATRFWLLA